MRDGIKMNKNLLVYTGLLSLFIVYTIHKYEAAIKQYKDSISDYKRALSLAKNQDNATHYTWLQLENKNLNQDNDALQVQIKSLKAQLAGDESKIQYEHSTYKSNKYDSSAYEKLTEL